MIDVENQIYTPIAEALREAFPGIDTSGEYVKAPSRLSPCKHCGAGQLPHTDSPEYQ